MKFIKTISWDFINAEDIYKITRENSLCGKREITTSVMYLRNGEKYDFYDTPDSFQIADGPIYIFCSWCHQKINEIVINRIVEFSGAIFEVEKYEDEIWEEFISEARQKSYELQKLKS